MGNTNEKFAELQLQISKTCTENEKNIILLYWKIDGLEFVHSRDWIKREFKFSLIELNKLIADNSALSFFVYCKNCQSYEHQKVKNKTQFITIRTKGRKENAKSAFLCNYCTQIAQKKLDLKKDQEYQILIKKLEMAIEHESWNNLDEYERELLGNCFEMRFENLKNHYTGKSDKAAFIKFTRSLEKIADQNLIVLLREEWNNSIVNFWHLPELSKFKDKIKVVRKNILVEKNSKSSVEIHHSTDELKFKLTINKNQHHPDSPLYAGTITFKERIVIEQGVEYIFGAWQRANENLYLTLTPIHNLDRLPIQKRICDKPISLQEGIKAFLHNLGKNF
ncbi:hypothetical protein SAMN05444395_11830 [Flavobacterium fryxellicola]|uniref:Uncharacterized protein n=1 Tax=Flavobacterium fryxellicola TaxID=249352 RepID=A0A167W188_9FLAO|nr:hypothetical protein [Flavobacterium fryxellicola]OAB26919.1 hypothetical protein FBFR_12475 [Flavobacterium fryxellicola]SHN79876.1 hypothetical protein SAMN05444395_11830 [Flavobacterium fryxellicola]